VQSFEHAPPEARNLLSRPIRELGLRIEGTPLEKAVQQLYAELAAKGLARFRPGVYLSDEWACPDREPVIGIPFYLASPQTAALERAMNDIEDEREILMYLRHEAGHAFNYAYKLYETRQWLDLFGPFDAPYDDDYTPVPFSRRFVRHIAGWYAQKHPDEDFAETFAVWLTPGSDWERRYKEWPALIKLRYVERIGRELGDVPPKKALDVAVRELPVEEMASTLEQFYKSQEVEEKATLEGLDTELEDLFLREGNDLRPASQFLRDHRKVLIDKVTYWTGVRRGTVRWLVEKMASRAKELELSVSAAREFEHLIEITAFATALAMNYLTRGKFAER
jgi:putative zinc-binding metallo-peptidase